MRDRARATRLRPAMRTFYDDYQRRLQEKRWTWDDIPFYAGRGSRQSIAPLHDLDYLDVYQRIYGRRIGANGIGKLREVGLTRTADADREEYAAVLERAGVSVHWIDEVDAPAQAGHGLLVVNGGAIAPDRRSVLAHWAFWTLNVPTLLTIAGAGAVAEAGATVWLAADVYVVGISAAYNRAGLEQLLSMVELTSGVDDLEVLTIRCQGHVPVNRTTGASAHVTNLIAPLDVDKVLAYKAGIDTATLLWLERNGYEVVEPAFAEHIGANAVNLVLLEPGRVVMTAAAPETVARVRAAGVEVIEVPVAGLRSATLELVRDPGPKRGGG
jgi:N-dimethylarginine dimethylaminohydrolase